MCGVCSGGPSFQEGQSRQTGAGNALTGTMNSVKIRQDLGLCTLNLTVDVELGSIETQTKLKELSSKSKDQKPKTYDILGPVSEPCLYVLKRNAATFIAAFE